MVSMKPIHDWVGEPGAVTSWHPSRATLAKVKDAPVSDVPVSYQQAQHLLDFSDGLFDFCTHDSVQAVVGAHVEERAARINPRSASSIFAAPCPV